MNGLYEVSNTGKVRSLKTNKVLKLNNNKSGYIYACLCKKGIKKLVRVHREVAKMFVSNPNNYKEVNHIDGNKLNNNANNLEWCSREHNMQHSFKNNLSKSNFTKSPYSQRGEKNPRCRKIKQLDMNGKLIREWNSIKSVYLELGFSQSYINGCCKGTFKSAYNFRWEYAE